MKLHAIHTFAISTGLILADFTTVISTYWSTLIYPCIILIEVIFMIIWGGEIMSALKQDSKSGKAQLQIWVLAAAFGFGVTYFLTDILQLMNINVNAGVLNR